MVFKKDNLLFLLSKLMKIFDFLLAFHAFLASYDVFLFESGEVVALPTKYQSNLFSRCYLFFTGSTMYPLSGLLTLRGCCMCHSPDMQQRFF